MAKSALPLLLVGGAALLVASKGKKKKKHKAAAVIEEEPIEEEPIEVKPKPAEPKPEVKPPPIGGETGSPDGPFCLKQGGTPEARFTDKGMIGVCVMPDGSTAEGFAFLRGDTKPGPVVSGDEAQGKVVTGQVGQTVTIWFDESTVGHEWSPAEADPGIEFRSETTNYQMATAAGAPQLEPAEGDSRKRYFMFELDKPGRWRVAFEHLNMKGEAARAVTLSIEALAPTVGG